MTPTSPFFPIELPERGWVLSGPGLEGHYLQFPGERPGQYLPLTENTARCLADVLNSAWNRGVKSAQRDVRKALGIPDPGDLEPVALWKAA